MKEMKALHEALTFHSALDRFDRAYIDWYVWKERNPEGFKDETSKREYWDSRKRFERVKADLERSLKSFVEKYGVLPFVRSGNDIVCEFHGESVSGYKTFIPETLDLFDKISKPKLPRKLSEVFC